MYRFIMCNMEELPKHIAVIMDGNGRWAEKRGIPKIFGHREGIKTVKMVVKAVNDLGIEALTLYAFSTENWKRSKKEVSALISLFCEYIEKEINELEKEGVRMRVLGDVGLFPKKMTDLLNKAIVRLEKNKRLILNLALNYGGRDEIIRATKRIVKDIKEGRVSVEGINESLFSSYLDTYPISDPDLLIRTSGEMRISNFLLWQMAYTELWITSVLWPDFTKDDLFSALNDYKARKRRFGAR
ncbi:MAG: isoprenyl transferase [bacterium]|nr:isoprenyl transferase [bacterium]